jgi:hypothetical protein
MTASLVAAQLADLYGLYILAHATNNRQLADRYSDLGLPTNYQPRTTSSYKAGQPDPDCCRPAMPDVQVHWEIVGKGPDHTIDAKTPSRRKAQSPPAQRSSGTRPTPVSNFS